MNILKLPRYCVVLISIIILARAAFGSLIVVIPTENGVVVASDTVVSVGGTMTSDLGKLRAVSPRTVVGVTGILSFKAGGKVLSLRDIAEDEIRRSGDSLITDAIMESFAIEIIKSMARFLVVHPGAIQGEICRVVAIQYDGER